MRKILATYYKEMLLVIRDKAGMAILFLMPLALIVIMALIQDAPFRNFQESGIKLALVDNDQDSLGAMIKSGFKNSGIFQVEESINGEWLNNQQLIDLVTSGDYKIGIIIPAKATQIVRNNVEKKVGKVLSKLGLNQQDEEGIAVDSLRIEIYLDPAAKKSFRSAISSSLREFTSKIESKMIMQAFMSQLTDEGDDNLEELSFNASDFIGLKEINASHDEKLGEAHFSNSVQHNVPAWTLFAMFFIVIPLAGNMIKEKNEGSLTRVRLIPGAYRALLLGKLFFYTSVCFVQFLLMIFVGIYILPYLGLPKLVMGNHILSVFAVAIAAALAATGYGINIGSIFKTQQQATTFGPVSIVILSAIGGVWVPLFAMPEIMRNIGMISPLNWALEAFNDLFLRGGNITTVFPEISFLLVFFILNMICAFVVAKYRDTH
jgi:ABC-2 type transport system permease protein